MTVEELQTALQAAGAVVERLCIAPCSHLFALRVTGRVNGQEIQGFITPPQSRDAHLIAENLIAHAEAVAHDQKIS